MVNKLKQYPRLLKCLSFIVIVVGVKIYEYFVAPLYATNFPTGLPLWLLLLIGFLILASTMIIEIIEGSIFFNTCFDADHFYELMMPLIITLSSIYVSNLLPIGKVLSIYTILIHIKTAFYGFVLIGKMIYLIGKQFTKK